MRLAEHCGQGEPSADLSARLGLDRAFLIPTRSLIDFAKLVELLFVSVTQAFNTTTSMGRLTLNVLLSFAQFEREVTGERIRDKIAALKKKGIWMGGVVPLGYRVENRALLWSKSTPLSCEACFRRYLESGSVVRLKAVLDDENLRLPTRTDRNGKMTGGGLISRGHLYKILRSLGRGRYQAALRKTPPQQDRLIVQRPASFARRRIIRQTQ